MSNRWEHELQQCLDTDIDFPVAEFIKLHTEVPPPTIRRRHAQLRATLMIRKCCNKATHPHCFR